MSAVVECAVRNTCAGPVRKEPYGSNLARGPLRESVEKGSLMRQIDRYFFARCVR